MRKFKLLGVMIVMPIIAQDNIPLNMKPKPLMSALRMESLAKDVYDRASSGATYK